MGRNMSVRGLIEEERVECISISLDELDKLDEYQQHEKLESKIIRFLENHPDEEVQKCGEVLRQIDRKQDGHILFLRKSERKQILGHGGNLELLEGDYEPVANVGGSKNPRDPYRKNTQTLL